MFWKIIKSSAEIIIGIAFLLVFISHLILGVHLRLRRLQNADPLSISWIVFIKNFITEICCTTIMIYSYPLGFFLKDPHFPKTKMSRKRSPPILFVHGYLHSNSAWLWFIHQLKKDPKIGPMYTINLWPPFASIADFAVQIQNKVKDILAKNKEKQVILIGHSMGGLASSYYCEYLAKENEVAKIITLGTPFNGTFTTVLGIGENNQEMTLNSQFLQKLNLRIEESHTPYYIVASVLDNMVIPWESALLKSRSCQASRVEDHGHLRFLLSPKIVAQVAEWIKS